MQILYVFQSRFPDFLISDEHKYPLETQLVIICFTFKVFDFRETDLIFLENC